MKAYLFAGCELRLVLAAASYYFDDTIDHAIASHGGLSGVPHRIRYRRYYAAEHLGLIDAQLAADLRAVSRLAAVSSERGDVNLCAVSNIRLIDALQAWREPALGGPALARIAHDPELRLRMALATLSASLARIAEPA